MDMSKYSYPRSRYLSWNPYDFHKHLINTYVLTRKGSTSAFKRDSSKDKRDIDIIRENHKFLWDDDEDPQSWEERLAKRYYDKLYKEFCISDLSRYKENKFAMRWQTEQELLTGKGQFMCGNKVCKEKECLRTWEVNFAYWEHGEKKNALVKLRLCTLCSKKLNYRHKKSEIKRQKKNYKRIESKDSPEKDASILSIKDPEDISGTSNTTSEAEGKEGSDKGEDIWKAPLEDTDEISREEEFEKYLEHLLL